MRLKKLSYFKFNATKGRFEYYCTNNDCWFTPANLNAAEIELADRDAKHISELKNKNPSDKYYEGRTQLNKSPKPETEEKVQKDSVKANAFDSYKTESSKEDTLQKLLNEQKRTNAFLETLINSQNQQKDELKDLQKEIYYLKYQIGNLKDKPTPERDLNMIELISNLKKLEKSSEKTLTRLEKIDAFTEEVFPVSS